MLITILVRYPRFPHEFGGDTLELNFFADALRQDGTAAWAMSPLSWFGLYPVSYPMAVPILAAHLGYVAGIPTEDALAICGVMVGVLSALATAVIAHRLSGSVAVAVVAAAAMALSGFNGPQTISGVSGRPVAQALFPLALWALIGPRFADARYSVVGLGPRTAVLLAANVTMAASHRLFLLAILCQIIVWVAGRVYLIFVAPEGARGRVHRDARLGAWFAAGGLLAWGALSLAPGVRAGPAFLNSFLATNDQSLFVAGYLIEFAYDVGPLVFLLPIGAWALISGSARWNAAYTGQLVCFGAVLFLVVPSFSSVTLAPFAYAMVGEGWRFAHRKRKSGPIVFRRLARATGAIAIALAVASQAYYISETSKPGRNPDGTSFYVDIESFESGAFLHWDSSPGIFVSPELTDSRRVATAGHVSTLSSEAIALVAVPELRDRITITGALRGDQSIWSPQLYLDAIQSILESKTLYAASDWIVPGGGYGFGNHWGQVVTVQDSARAILEAYKIDHVLTNNYHSSSRLTTVVEANFYAEYANSLETVYRIHVPPDCSQRGPFCR